YPVNPNCCKDFCCLLAYVIPRDLNDRRAEPLRVEKETHHGPETNVRFPGYSTVSLPGQPLLADVYGPHRGHLSGGLLILVRNDLQYRPTVSTNYSETGSSYMLLGVTLLGTTVPLPFNIITGYFRPGLNLDEVDLPDLPLDRCLFVGD
ncbi:hypothetical protein FOZ62_003551, partial [Perkinsus olseni]